MVRAVLQAMLNIGGLPSQFVGDIAETFFDDYFDILVYSEVLYVLIVFLGPKAMESREPYRLKYLIAAWNLALSFLSLCGTIGVSIMLMHSLEERGMYETTCYLDKNLYDGELTFWLFAFLLSKIPEMLDTVFLVLTKKPIIFLHWYHHLTVTVFCWYAGYTLIASGVWFASMNYAVHTVMYFYYFLCSLGMRKFIRPIAPFITGAQLLQMVVGTIIVLYTFYYSYISERGCGVDHRTIRMGLCMYGSYFVLFATLFVHLYMKKGAATKSRKTETAAAAAAAHQNGKPVDGAKNGCSAAAMKKQ
ncbi:fatty acid elongase, putative [Leishmania donovani]|uniref:Elongation of fatty acids protein n=1 Tax=Leishmania donovani TaxID=5661 RepID=E9BBW3_LEIDO|nr:fatty acid elongase, putative [Leishmania donovani]TPP46263.1 GNS1/SUR4 family protein [Leishmania donovani]CBZ32738.1 fatty acid elongase, putative [Leishmania donovani]